MELREYLFHDILTRRCPKRKRAYGLKTEACGSREAIEGFVLARSALSVSTSRDVGLVMSLFDQCLTSISRGISPMVDCTVSDQACSTSGEREKKETMACT